MTGKTAMMTATLLMTFFFLPCPLAMAGHPKRLYISPTAMAPADGTEAAPTTLQDGVSRARTAGSTELLLSPGAYELEEEVVLDSSILLKGRDGAAKTVLRRVNLKANKGDILAQRVLRIDHPEARAEGLTLANGSTWLNNGDPVSLEAAGGGVLIGPRGGTLASCIVSNNVGGRVMNGAGVALLGEKALVTNCLIVGNTLKSSNGWNGYGAGAYMKAGLITHSTLLENTNHMANATAGGGAFLAGGTISHCRILRNDTLRDRTTEPGSI